ncbi:MAG: hypothetical protein JWO19_5297 [Bryobacterales bacterium]|jgi:hypothetical protein|nr:hypothetical protein [Bryobacterales bacterium]
MARKAFHPSEEERRWVTVMSSYGVRQEDMATEVGLRSPKTLRKHFREELDRGRIGAEYKVRKTLFELAESGAYPSVSMHWLNRQAGWRAKGARENRPVTIPDFVVARDKEAA